MWSVTQWIPERLRLICEGFDIFDFEAEMGEVRADHDRSAAVVLADLDLLVATGMLR